jgi:hypothetical protein
MAALQIPAGEYSTHDGMLRQTKTHNFQAIPVLTSFCAFDVMRVPVVIRVTVGASCAAHGLKYLRKGPSSFMVGSVCLLLQYLLMMMPFNCSFRNKNEQSSSRGGGCHHQSAHAHHQKFCSVMKNILFLNGELSLLWPGVAARCRRGRGMGGQGGLRADADAW